MDILYFLLPTIIVSRVIPLTYYKKLGWTGLWVISLIRIVMYYYETLFKITFIIYLLIIFRKIKHFSHQKPLDEKQISLIETNYND
jgi:hypothetical protein